MFFAFLCSLGESLLLSFFYTVYVLCVYVSHYFCQNFFLFLVLVCFLKPPLMSQQNTSVPQPESQWNLSFLARDLALSLWNGSTDNKNLDCQKTSNPRNIDSENSHEVPHLYIRPATPNCCQHPVQDTLPKQQTRKKEKRKPNHLNSLTLPFEI